VKIRQGVQRSRPARCVGLIDPGEHHASLEGRQSGSRGGCGPASQLARGTTDENILGARVQHPVVTLARIVVVTGHLDEALVEGEIVPDGILPTLLVVLVVGKMAHYVLVDAVQGEPLLRTLPDGHHDQRVVAVRRFLRLLLVLGLLLRVLLTRRADGRRARRAIQRWRFRAVTSHVEIAAVVAVIDVTHVGGIRLAGRRRRCPRTGLRHDAANAEVALQGSPWRRRGCHGMLLA